MISKRYLTFISVSCLLLSCTDEQLVTAFPTLDPRIEESPMSNESKEAVRAYFNKPNPKAFAFSPEKGVNWHAWGSSDAKKTALSMCESQSSTKCELFAVNNKIVWGTDRVSRSSSNEIEGTPHKTIASVNLRSGPGSKYPSLLVLPEGEAVQSLGLTGNWHAVTTDDGRIGYIYRDYVSAE